MKYLTKLYQIIVIFACLYTFTSCKSNTKQKESYIGNKIIFPDSLFLFEKDTLLLTNQSFYNSDNNKIICLMRADCGKCIDDFNKLNSFLNELEEDFECFFMISTRDLKFFKANIYPSLVTSFYLIYNKNNRFEKENKLEGTYSLFNTFLMNNQNEIVFIGNPIHNKSIQNEYIDIIVLQNE